MRNVKLNLITLALTLAAQTHAYELEKLAIMTDKGFHLVWWPKVSVPHGWTRDEHASLQHSCNALVPKGKTFDDAETIIYAKANYEPDKKSRGTLAQFVKDDIAEFQEHGAVAQRVTPSMTNAKGHQLPTYRFLDGSNGFEETSYGQEGDFWLIFVISSKTLRGLNRDLPIFRNMLSKYR